MIRVPVNAVCVFKMRMSVVERMTMSAVHADVIVIFARHMRMHVAQWRDHQAREQQEVQDADQAEHGGRVYDNSRAVRQRASTRDAVQQVSATKPTSSKRVTLLR
jgi:hypothetical protein